MLHPAPRRPSPTPASANASGLPARFHPAPLGAIPFSPEEDLMPLIDLLRPNQRAALRRLRKRIANRENMRRYRSDLNYMQLCPGVDLPLEAGTCGRLIWPESTRCTACRKRRDWLLTHALNPAEVALCTLLDGVEADDTEHDACAPEDQAVPLLDNLSALGDPCLRW